MMQNQDFCNRKLSGTLTPDWLQCECGAAVEKNKPNHRPLHKQPKEGEPSPSTVSHQYPLFTLPS